MRTMKSKFFALYFFLATVACGLLPTGLQAQGVYQGQGMCCPDKFVVGADFLYWKFCACDNDLSFRGDLSIFDFDIGKFELSAKGLDTCYEPGVRVFFKADECLCGFGAGLVYTYYCADAKKSTDLSTSIFFIPSEIEIEGITKGHWEFDYHTLDAVITAPLQVSCNTCLDVTAFGGIKWLRYCEDRHDNILEDTIIGPLLKIKRDLEVWGVGPTVGVKSDLTLCDCIHFFGMFATSLMVGEKDSLDHYEFFPEIGQVIDLDFKLKDKNNCVCFPGMHFMTGLSYESCLCDMNFGVRLGWEYVTWINAPTFPFYGFRSRTARGDRNLTLQGLFAGLYASF